MSGAQPDLWLIRTSDHLIAGPYSGEQVKGLLKGGELGPNDEICRANDYWIALHEREELLKKLGVEPPVMAGPVDDPQTATDVDRTRPDMVAKPLEIPELDAGASASSPLDNARRAQREFVAFKPKPRSERKFPKPDRAPTPIEVRSVVDQIEEEADSSWLIFGIVVALLVVAGVCSYFMK